MVCYVQIGAGAGDSDVSIDYRDGFSSFIKSGILRPDDRIIVVEANEQNLEALRASWKDFSNVFIHHKAICSKINMSADSIKLYYSLDDGPHFTISSTLREHVEKFYTESSIRSYSVPCVDINTFLNQTCQGSSIELLATDIEGMDIQFLNELDLSRFDIHKISFEKSHGGVELKNLKTKLRSAGYRKAGMGMDPHNSDVLWIKPIDLRELLSVYLINLKHSCWEIQIPARHFLKTKFKKILPNSIKRIFD